MKKTRKRRFSLKIGLVIGILFVLSFTSPAYSQFFGDQPFDKAEPAVETQLNYNEGLILFKFDLDKSHHITDLKNDFFKIMLEKNDFLEILKVIFPKGVPFGEEMVFKGAFTVKVYVKSLKPVTDPVKLNFKVSYQICQEKPQEVCFPPEEKNLEITVSQLFAAAKIETTSPAEEVSLKDLSAGTATTVHKTKRGNWVVLLVAGLVLLALVVFIGFPRNADAKKMKGKFIKAFFILLIVAGVGLFLKALEIKYSPGTYIQKPKKTIKLDWIRGLPEGKTIAAKENKPIMIDTYADWCVACKELDEYTFSDPEVAKVLKGYVPVKLDFTARTVENKALQNDLKIIGLPTVIFLDSSGKELRRFSGFLNKDQFLKFMGSGEGWLERLIKLLKQELEKKSLLLFALVFILGFLTSLTPCVYPVIPIVMGYIGTRSGQKKAKGFYLSIFFVLGLALVYSLLGVIAGMAGSMVGATFQNPIVVIVISAVFIIMGLSLAGLFEIPIPSSISSKVQASGSKSEIFSALLVGGVAGIIAAPCAGPVLVTLLSWISQTRDALLGFLLTFVFSLGMGIIFLVVGTFSGVVSALPKGGKWMDYIKYFFAVLLVAGGIYILNALVPGWLYLLLWGIFLVSLTVFAGLFKTPEEYRLKNKIYKFILFLICLVGIFLLYKGLELKFFPAPTAAAPVPIEQKL